MAVKRVVDSALAGNGISTDTWAAGAVFGTTGTLRSLATSTRIGMEDRLNIASGSGTAAMTYTSSASDADIVFQGFLPSCPAAGSTSGFDKQRRYDLLE